MDYRKARSTLSAKLQWTMETDSATPLPRRRRLSLGMALLLGGVGVLMVLGLAITIVLLKGSRDLDAELARIRAAGEPASAEELEAFYKRPPADQDTTVLWLAALDSLDTPEYEAAAKDLPFVDELREPNPSPSEQGPPWPGEPWPKLTTAEQLLFKYRKSLALVHKLARRRGRARFPVDFASGDVLSMMPHCHQLRAVTRLLQLETAIAAHRGDASAAIDAITTILWLARVLDEEPLLVSQLARFAICNIAAERVEWLLSAMPLDDDQLAAFDADLAATECQKTLRLGLLGERAVVIEALENPQILGHGSMFVQPGIVPKSDHAAYLQVMAKMISAADKTGADRKELLNHVKSRLEHLRSALLSTQRYPITHAMTRALDILFDAADRSEAHRDSARLAVAIERFQLRHGRLPEELDELTPEFIDHLPIDPFDGAPLRYRIDPTEYLLYSVGADGIDQGGLADPPGRPVDLVFRVRRKDVGRQPDSSTAEPQP